LQFAWAIIEILVGVGEFSGPVVSAGMVVAVGRFVADGTGVAWVETLITSVGRIGDGSWVCNSSEKAKNSASMTVRKTLKMTNRLLGSSVEADSSVLINRLAIGMGIPIARKRE
jgi:hypothetical protein